MYNIGDLIEYNAESWKRKDSSMRTWTGLIIEKKEYGVWADCAIYKICFYHPEETTIEFDERTMFKPCIRKVS